MKTLNEEQFAAIATTHQNTVVIAGPGSGKTEVLARAIVRSIEMGTPAAGIVCLTFTNAAAREIRDRVAGFFPGETVRLGHCGTLHAFCLKLLRGRLGLLVGLPDDVTVMDEGAAGDLLQRAIDERNYKGTTKALKACMAAGPSADILSRDWTSAKYGLDPKAPEAVNLRYWALMQSGGVLDYNALLYLAGRLAKVVTIEQWRRCAGCSILHADEAQDLSAADFEMLDAFPFDARFYVGDPDQAIYGFRGGDVRSFVQHAQWGGNRVGWGCFILSGNYRSGRTICKAANALIHNNRVRVSKLTVPAIQRDAGWDLLTLLVKAPDEDAELAGIAREIQRLTPEEREETAVLLRTNRHAQEVEKYLSACSVEVRRRDRADLPQDWSYALRALAVLQSPNNATAAFLLMVSRCGAQDARQAAQQSALNGSRLLPWEIAAVNGVAEVPGWLARMGVSVQSIARVNHMIGAGSATIQDLLTFNATEDLGQMSGTGVTVTTIHGAKGREWTTVFCPGWDTGLFPYRPVDKMTPDEMEEERRVAYVAITRAKRNLTISHAVSRREPWPPHRAKAVNPSPFFLEVAKS